VGSSGVGREIGGNAPLKLGQRNLKHRKKGVRKTVLPYLLNYEYNITYFFKDFVTTQMLLRIKLLYRKRYTINFF
jgi:hypothetical protein